MFRGGASVAPRAFFSFSGPALFFSIRGWGIEEVGREYRGCGWRTRMPPTCPCPILLFERELDTPHCMTIASCTSFSRRSPSWTLALVSFLHRDEMKRAGETGVDLKVTGQVGCDDGKKHQTKRDTHMETHHVAPSGIRLWSAVRAAREPLPPFSCPASAQTRHPESPHSRASWASARLIGELVLKHSLAFSTLSPSPWPSAAHSPADSNMGGTRGKKKTPRLTPNPASQSLDLTQPKLGERRNSMASEKDVSDGSWL